jgi:hypothetical protein
VVNSQAVKIIDVPQDLLDRNVHIIVSHDKLSFAASELGAKYLDWVLNLGWRGVYIVSEIIDDCRRTTGKELLPIEGIASLAVHKMMTDYYRGTLGKGKIEN